MSELSCDTPLIGQIETHELSRYPLSLLMYASRRPLFSLLHVAHRRASGWKAISSKQPLEGLAVGGLNDPAPKRPLQVRK